MDWMIESIGLTAGAIGLISWIPQLFTVWRDREHRGINLNTLYLISVALMLWMVYGVTREAIAVMVSNTCSLTAIMGIIIRVKWLRRQEDT